MKPVKFWDRNGPEWREFLGCPAGPGQSRFLGQGSFATAYRLGDFVVKVFGNTPAAANVWSFQKEAFSALQQIRFPSPLVTMVDSGNLRNGPHAWPFLVMTMAEGIRGDGVEKSVLLSPATLQSMGRTLRLAQDHLNHREITQPPAWRFPFTKAWGILWSRSGETPDPWASAVTKMANRVAEAEQASASHCILADTKLENLFLAKNGKVTLIDPNPMSSVPGASLGYALLSASRLHGGTEEDLAQWGLELANGFLSPEASSGACQDGHREIIAAQALLCGALAASVAPIIIRQCPEDIRQSYRVLTEQMGKAAKRLGSKSLPLRLSYPLPAPQAA